MNQIKAEILNAVLFERQHQRALLREGKIKFDCASPIVCNDRKLRVAAEEHGEVAEAIDLLENAKSDKKRKAALSHLFDELTQCAAVSIAWMEAVHEELNR